MARKNLEIGDRVTLYSFGVHPGVVIGFDPTIVVQGRTVHCAGWVKVRTDAGLEWNGDRKLLRFGSARIRAAA